MSELEGDAEILDRLYHLGYVEKSDFVTLKDKGLVVEETIIDKWGYGKPSWKGLMILRRARQKCQVLAS